MQRRKFLKIIGGSAVFMGACTNIYAAPTAKSARAAWKNAEQYSDPMRFALSHAILAPNPHNRQPWQVVLTGAHEAVLYCDPKRHLPHTDPLDRQITIGLGCFLEHFAIAAAHKGFNAEFNLFPEGAAMPQLDTRPVAHIRLSETPSADAHLFPHIYNRRTDRTPYSDTQVSTEQINTITNTAGVLASATHSSSIVKSVTKICKAANHTEFHTPNAHQESVDLMRIGRKQIKANPDGISIEGPMIELLKPLGIINAKSMRDPTSTAFKKGLKMSHDAISATPALVWITTPDNTRNDQIAAGRAYARANLQATALGLSMQPLSQALQEYPEMTVHLQAIHEALDIKTPKRLQMLARVGYGQADTHSPRWPLSTRIQDA